MQTRKKLDDIFAFQNIEQECEKVRRRWEDLGGVNLTADLKKCEGWSGSINAGSDVAPTSRQKKTWWQWRTETPAQPLSFFKMEDKPDYGLNTPFCDDTIGEMSACLFYWTKLDNYVNQIKPSFGGFVWCFVLNVEFGEDCPWPDHLLSPSITQHLLVLREWFWNLMSWAYGVNAACKKNCHQYWNCTREKNGDYNLV